MFRGLRYVFLGVLTVGIFGFLFFVFTVQPLELPDNPPERIGFTEVEWGGTIGY